MNPHNYLNSLKALTYSLTPSHRGIDPNSSPGIGNRETFPKTERNQRFFDVIDGVTSLVEHTAEQFVKVLPAGTAELLRAVPVGELPTGTFGASVRAVPGGGAVITIDAGFSMTVQQALGWYLAASRTASGEEAQIEPFRAAEMIAKLTLARQLRQWRWLASQMPNAPIVGEKKGWMVTFAWQNAIEFALAHELSHVLLGHLDSADRSTMAAEGNGGPPMPPEYVWPHQKEFDADRNAAVMMYDAAPRKHPEMVHPEMPGIIGSACVMELLHLAERLAPPSARSRSHPPARERREALSSVWREQAGATAFAEEIEQMQGFFDYTAQLALWNRGRRK